MPNPNNFIVDSDYPFDMVAKVLSGSVTKPPLSGGQAVELGDFNKIPHGLNFTPLVSGFYSDTPDFELNLALGSTPSLFTQSQMAVTVIDCGADSNDVYLLVNGSPGDVIYYKIYCLVPTDLAQSVTVPTLGGFQNYIFNSDLSYMKIAKEGSADIQGGEPLTISHNLGFVPFVRFWSSSIFDSNILEIGGGYMAGNTVSVTDKDITLRTTNNVASETAKIFYRIYADET